MDLLGSLSSEYLTALFLFSQMQPSQRLVTPFFQTDIVVTSAGRGGLLLPRSMAGFYANLESSEEILWLTAWLVGWEPQWLLQKGSCWDTLESPGEPMGSFGRLTDGTLSAGAALGPLLLHLPRWELFISTPSPAGA